jgi:hypothetical protein
VFVRASRRYQRSYGLTKGASGGWPSSLSSDFGGDPERRLWPNAAGASLRGLGAEALPTSEIEPPHVIAKRVFDALCARFPRKYIALIQPRSVPDDKPLTGHAEKSLPLAPR